MTYIKFNHAVIDPTALIKEAELGAQVEADSESQIAKEAVETAKTEKDSTLDKRASGAVDNIEELLKDTGFKMKVDSPKEKTAKPNVKEANANVIKLQMQNEALTEELTKEPEAESMIPKYAGDLSDSKILELNEKVASSDKLAFLSKALPIAASLGVGAVGGFGLASNAGKKKLNNYISADKERDAAVTDQAFQAGQMFAVDKIREAIQSSKGAVA